MGSWLLEKEWSLQVCRIVSSIYYEWQSNFTFIGLTPVFYMPIYTASKYGIVGFTRSVSVCTLMKKR